MSLPSTIQKLFPVRSRIDLRLRVLSRSPFELGERWLLEYEGGHERKIRAWFLIPKSRKRLFPAILAAHQHNGEFHLGKSEPAGLDGSPDCFYGTELCARGFVVICPDHLGFEDRQQKRVPGRFSLEGREYERFLLCDALLRGGSLTAVYLHDLQLALDVLEGFEFVDSNRLGAIGHSLGGQTVTWLAAADRRVRAAFSSCGLSTMDAVQRRHIPHNAAAYLPGLLSAGDMDGVVTSVAPRAFGMSSGLEDKSFPLDGIRRIHRAASEVFPRGKFKKILFRGGHAFPPSVRELAYDFLFLHLHQNER